MLKHLLSRENSHFKDYNVCYIYTNKVNNFNDYYLDNSMLLYSTKRGM